MFVVCIYIFSEYFVHFSSIDLLFYLITILAPYSVDPDQLASQKLADLDLHS